MRQCNQIPSCLYHFQVILGTVKNTDSENKSEGNGLSRGSADIGGGVLSGVGAGFELDESVNMGSVFLQGMLSEKEPVGFSVGYELLWQHGTAGDIAMDNEAPTDGEWKNL